MLISERIFEKLNELSMTQKEFSEKTGIRQTTISEWKKQLTPYIICLKMSVYANSVRLAKIGSAAQGG